MNIVKFIMVLCANICWATVTSLLVAVGILEILVWIIYLFKLNEGRDTYWALNVATYSLVISWIISFGYFMSITK
jgi:heme/copper-type cytochrome/quinol oxidase subunit 4